MSESELETMMAAADSNSDGRVDYTEFVTAAYDRVKLLSQRNITRAFNMFDKNGDGQITEEELTRSVEPLLSSACFFADRNCLHGAGQGC